MWTIQVGWRCVTNELLFFVTPALWSEIQSCESNAIVQSWSRIYNCQTTVLQCTATKKYILKLFQSLWKHQDGEGRQQVPDWDEGEQQWGGGASLSPSLLLILFLQVAAMWARCEDHYSKKLWHQLTLQVWAELGSLACSLLPSYSYSLNPNPSILIPLS